MKNKEEHVFEILTDKMETNGLHDSLLEHYENSESFLGYLLTLNKEEFDYIYKKINSLSENPMMDVSLEFSMFIMIYHHKGMPEHKAKMTQSEFQKSYTEIVKYVAIIDLYKKGFMKIVEQGDKDENWLLGITEEGKKFIKGKQDKESE